MLFTAFILTANGQKGLFDSMWESNDSILFVWDGGIYLPATIDNNTLPTSCLPQMPTANWW